MSKLKAQVNDKAQMPKPELQRKVFDIASLGFDLSFGFCHLTFSISPCEVQSGSTRNEVTDIIKLRAGRILLPHHHASL